MRVNNTDPKSQELRMRNHPNFPNRKAASFPIPLPPPVEEKCDLRDQSLIIWKEPTRYYHNFSPDAV
jgi:hypothetical protein